MATNTLDKSNSRIQDSILSGLLQPQKTISSQWLYDEVGSKLYEDITKLDEYYVARTETEILKTYANGIAECLPQNAALAEYGAGAAIKTRFLLDAMPTLQYYCPIDISTEFLADTVISLRQDYPDINIHPVAGNFLDAVTLPKFTSGTEVVGFFPGSTIGNLLPNQVGEFLGSAKLTLGTSSKLLIGIDLIKPLDVLLPAYNDKDGVTAAFNLNILKHINQVLPASFDISSFQHEARWSEQKSRIEMHLVSQHDQTVSAAGSKIHFKAGESIHTENSHKFDLDDFCAACAKQGWRKVNVWTDKNNYFALVLLAS